MNAVGTAEHRRDPWDRAVPGIALGAISIVAAGAAPVLLLPHRPTLTDVFARVQDVPVLMLTVALIGLLATPRLALSALAASVIAEFAQRRSAWLALILAAFAFAAGALGWASVYHRYPLSMDEFWASFDARVFSHGRLLAPVSSQWRPYVGAMQPMWRLETPGDVAWGSTYLPVNAALQALFARLGSAALAAPACAALSVGLLYALARQTWPDRPDAAAIAALLLATSSQLLVTAMSPYAMSAHLAFNLLWLWLFRQPHRWAQAGAALTAFAATGLHQIVFHPLFAAPFVLQLWLERRWAAAAFHTLAYAVIGLFWLSWWPIVFALEGIPADTAGAAARGATAFALARALDPTGPFLMAWNLLRFVLWQNPLATPLAIVGVWWTWRSRGGPVAPLAAGIVVTVVVLTLLTPFQGHGWGYRYLHGFLGALCLIAAEGWVRLVPRPREAGKAWARLSIACAAALLILLPVRLGQVSRFIAPYARAETAIRGASAAVVIVDPTGLWYGDDLVRNDPFLLQGPKVMNRYLLTDGRIQALCASGLVSVFDRSDAAVARLPSAAPSKGAPSLPLSVVAPGCARHVLAGGSA